MFSRQEKKSDHDTELFVIYDTKVGVYEKPHEAINSQDVIRSLHNMFRDQGQSQNRYFLNAEDYSVFRIGKFSKRTGLLEACNPIEHIVNMHDIRSAIQREQQDPKVMTIPQRDGC